MKHPLPALSVLLLGLAAPGRARAMELVSHAEAQFKMLFAPGAEIRKLAGDLKFVEGPVWIPADGGYLVFSDIPANQLKKWTAKEGLATFRDPSQNSNGNTTDA